MGRRDEFQAVGRGAAGARSAANGPAKTSGRGATWASDGTVS